MDRLYLSAGVFAPTLETMIGSFWSTPPFTLNPNLPCSSGTMVIDTSSPLASPVDVAAVAASASSLRLRPFSDDVGVTLSDAR